MSSKNPIRLSRPKGIKILFADDEVPLQELIADELPRMGHVVTVCADGEAAVSALEKNTFDCIIVDLDMPGLNGIQVIERAKQFSPSTEAIVLTGKSSKETAIAALRLGAFDYLQKPCTLVELQTRLQRVADKREMTKRIYSLEHRLRRVEGPVKMVGSHPSMERVKSLIAKVAPTNSIVLILGETGTGKELVAEAIHRQSARSEQPFLAVNCGALPEHLIESEFFGHRKGAFTGANDHRSGLFEVADQGTLFLDEIGELPKSMQSKLLRVLESGEVRRVGENQPFQVDTRVICATHRNLPEMVERGEFREDLFYRINAFEIPIPPLRERASDIPELARHLFARFRPECAGQNDWFDVDALAVLESGSWPGNIRELANVIEHASILCDSPPVRLEHLPRHIVSPDASTTPRKSLTALRDIEFHAIQTSIERNKGNKTAAAQELGISLRTLYNKLGQETNARAA